MGDELKHYGVLGMKWGVRKDRKPQGYGNPNYTKNQRKRDRQVYGKRGERRINKAMNKGDSISVARGSEKTRRDRVMSKNKYVRQTGKIAGAGVGAGVGYLVTKSLPKALLNHGTTVVRKTMGMGAATSYVTGVMTMHKFMQDPIVKTSIIAGSGKVGHMLAGDVAVGARMRAHGYDPNRR